MCGFVHLSGLQLPDHGVAAPLQSSEVNLQLSALPLRDGCVIYSLTDTAQGKSSTAWQSKRRVTSCVSCSASWVLYIHQWGLRPPWRDAGQSQGWGGWSLRVWLTESPHPETTADPPPEPEGTILSYSHCHIVYNVDNVNNICWCWYDVNNVVTSSCVVLTRVASRPVTATTRLIPFTSCLSETITRSSMAPVCSRWLHTHTHTHTHTHKCCLLS